MKSSLVYLVFDTETTGLKSRHHWYKKKGEKEETNGNAGLIELACCPIDNELNDLPEFDSGIISLAEDREINQGALDANGITREQIENGRDPKEVAKEFQKYVKTLSKSANKIILAGHNINDFDIPFLTDFLEEQGVDLFKLVNKSHTIDTLLWARCKWVELPNYKLGTCCEKSEVDLVDAHRAINDTRANKKLLKDFLKKLRGEGSQKVTEEEYKRPRFQF